MSEHKGEFLAPPVLAQIRNEENSARVRMERSVSQEIRDERADLKEAAEHSLNVIIELGLDGLVRWVSASWKNVVGTEPEAILGKPVSTLFLAEQEGDPFAEAVSSMKNDDSKSQIIHFATRLGPSSVFSKTNPSSPLRRYKTDGPNAAAGPNAEDDNDHTEAGDDHDEETNQDEDIITLEGQGIMVYDRRSGEQSHTMWMLRPAVEPREITIDLPESLVETLGFGAEVLANYLTAIADENAEDPANRPPMTPILCRICEREITPWWFEKHSDLCLQENKAESEVQQAHEALMDQRKSIEKVLDALSAARPPRSGEPSPSPTLAAEYKGYPITPLSSSSSGSTSGRASPATPPRSRDTSQPGFSHSRARSFTVRRPVRHIVELLIDLCDTALEIKAPALITDNRQGFDGEFRTQTPTSETRISQVLNFQTPSNNILEAEQGLALLSSDTEHLAREKVEATMRHRQIIEYSERIRIELHVLVQDCIEAAIRKAINIREGRDSSSESELEDDDCVAPDERPDIGSDVQDRLARSMDLALQGVAELNLDTHALRRRSVAISTGSNSPMECPTPRSHAIVAGALARSHSISKRSSLYAASDAGDSDGSLSSSMIASSQRTDSPSQELSRSRSSRDPKRRSLKLPAVSNSPHRHPSPGTVPLNPSSPMRMPRDRLPSGSYAGISSPIASPMIASADPGSPMDHRRHSSILSTDGTKLPPSPRLTAINQQPKAVPPSIKDFEIIKPISKGAFGSVYLSKKKATGDYFAIKVLRKSDMVAKNQVTNIKAERAIMMWQGESDFVAKLYWTFSSKDYLYLVMEYLNGGDCASLIKSLGCLPEPWAKKYLAEVVLGVDHLHSRGIVHRDLKPDNLLIDQKGHLKLTDFGLSRMGLVGRQKRWAKSPNNSVPDLLKSGPFVRAQSMGSSRSASFDFPPQSSPANTPSMTPDLNGPNGQPSYFSLTRESSLGTHHSRRASGYRSDSGSSDTFHAMFKNMSLDEPTPRGPPIEEESFEHAYSPEMFSMQLSSSQANMHTSGTPPQSGMLPPPMALYDPEDQNRRFVGTPDYLAPETINGLGQDESSDWWSCGCILYEFLFGLPPFHAETPEKVFENILSRNLEWPTEEELEVSAEARDIIDRLITTDTKKRLGSNASENHKSGGEEIRNHPWFEGINWDTLFEDEAQFVPQTENPEDTEYFDSRGATLHAFTEELEDQSSSPAPTPGADYQERPHDALSGLRRQVNNSIKRTLMPLHIPAHVRESRTRRLSEPVANDDFGAFAFKNLPVLEKANKDVIQKLRAEAKKEQPKKAPGDGQASGNNSPAPSVEGSPLLPSPLKRTLSTQRGANKPALPSNLGSAVSSPHRMSQPTSPLLVQFSTGPNHERRKTSGSSSNSFSAQQNTPSTLLGLSTPASLPSQTSSPIKASRPQSSVAIHSPDASFTPIRARNRSQTVGSQEDSLSPKPFRNHYKRRSQVLDVSPSSSDNEDTRAKALLRVQRRRQSSRRLSQFSLMDGPCFRPLDVLLCEDHPVSRMVMERLFEKLRCRTISVLTGPEAVRFATSEVQFDVIMMEVKLPQLNGADVARMIRGTKNVNQHTPIVAVTGYLKELPQSHQFDELIEKPPTADKLTEVLCRLCSWQAPPPDWHPGPQQQQQHIPSQLRQEAHVTEDSPSSQSSGPFGTNPGASYRMSSREDSVTSSSLFGDMELDTQGSSGVVINGASDDWDGHGLGISGNDDSSGFTHPGLPHLLHFNSAPPILDITLPSPRKAPSSEAIRAKKEMHERKRHECIESGDDEDDELGGGPLSLSQSGSRSKGSKLSTQMMRTNSRGSVVSGDEMAGIANLMPPPTSTPEKARIGPAGGSGFGSPPKMLPRAPGNSVKEIEMDATPRPTNTNRDSPDDGETPKAAQTIAPGVDTSPSPAPAGQRDSGK